ncbi:hypothetical protein Tco_0787269 [Tanacetum coccineum]
MTAPVITISFDATEESVGSVFLRVILFGTIPTKVPIVLDIPTDIPTAPELPAVSPFLCSDDSKSDPESEPADEIPERHVSLRPFSAMILVAPIPPAPSTKTTTTSLACDILTPVINTSLAIRIHIRTTIRKSTLGLRPVMTPAESSSTASLQGKQISPEDHSYHSSEAARFPSGPLTCRRPQCLDYATSTSSSSVGPSRKRSRSSATSVPSTFHTAGALSSARADLLPPHKRYRDIRADIKAKTATTVVTVDGLGIKPVMIVVKMGLEPGLAVFESESEPEEAEADDKADVEIQPEGTVEIGVDVTIGIDIPNDLLMLDAIERLEKLEEGVQGMYEHILEIPLQRIEDIKARQTNQQARNLIVDDERSSLLERVAALECSNTKLQDALGVERVRADSLQRRLGYVEDELRHIRKLRSHESQRL